MSWSWWFEAWLCQRRGILGLFLVFLRCCFLRWHLGMIVLLCSSRKSVNFDDAMGHLGSWGRDRKNRARNGSGIFCKNLSSDESIKENVRLSRFSNIVDIFSSWGGLNNHDFSALSFLKVRQLMKAFHLSQQWDAKLIRCCMLIFFFALFCICISVLGRNDMKMKREFFAFSFA